MTRTTDCNAFNWNELLGQIDAHNVIPVIGQGLYRVCKKDDDEFLLYQYLAEKIELTLDAELGVKVKDQISHSFPRNHLFSKMVSLYLERKYDDYAGLRKIMTQNLSSVYPTPRGPLWKLSRIKPFSLFINTTYDHFLEHSLRSVRKYPTEVLSHTKKEKRTDTQSMAHISFRNMSDLNRTLVLHLCGSTARNYIPAYTDNDVLETLVTLQRDMGNEPKNPFFQTLEEKSLLFIGCGFDDWLFRFFVRIIASEPYKTPMASKFIGDDFTSPNCEELVYFFKTYKSELYHHLSGEKGFVDMLLEKIESKYPEHIISEKDFPDTAFISFHGDNRAEAVQLVSNLQTYDLQDNGENSINIWLDQEDLEPGDGVDETIRRAIDKCPVFIPLLSEASREEVDENNKKKYHIREWDWAIAQHKKGKNPRIITPVKIDKTNFTYKFGNKVFAEIPGGNRTGDYVRLRDRLLEIQKRRGKNEF